MDFESEKRKILEQSAEENVRLYEKYKGLRKKGLDGMPVEFVEAQRELIRKTMDRIQALKEKFDEQDRK